MPMDMAAKPEAGVSGWAVFELDELEPELDELEEDFTKPNPSNPNPFALPSPPLWNIVYMLCNDDSIPPSPEP